MEHARSQFAELSRRHQGNALRSTVRDGAVVVRERVRTNVNRLPQASGATAKDVSIETRANRTEVRAKVGVRKGKGRAGFRLHLIEFGVPANNVPPRPILRPAIDEGAPEVVRVMADRLGDQIARVVARNAVR